MEISANSWQIVSDPPVKLRRAKSKMSVPVPAQGNRVDELRLGLVNLKSGDEAGWHLLLAWLIAALRPTGPYPVLTLQASTG